MKKLTFLISLISLLFVFSCQKESSEPNGFSLEKEQLIQNFLLEWGNLFTIINNKVHADYKEPAPPLNLSEITTTLEQSEDFNSVYKKLKVHYTKLEPFLSPEEVQDLILNYVKKETDSTTDRIVGTPCYDTYQFGALMAYNDLGSCIMAAIGDDDGVTDVLACGANYFFTMAILDAQFKRCLDSTYGG
ncbi:MAG TPA: hypothetical protein PKE06_01420 [Flavilitoribacter sp.]|nr:hypothetical protein [Flavilitoribacter sp.]HMQ86349.1 hypothetical protein [Flavilitoribacter sp.]